MERDPRTDPQKGDSIQLGTIRRDVTERRGNTVVFRNGAGQEKNISLMTWRQFWNHPAMQSRAILTRAQES